MSAGRGALSHVVRTIGFIRKELWSVLRQPRLILTLVVGPFLILLIFGFGYTEQIKPLRTVIAVESDEARLATDVDDLGDAFGSSIELVGTTTDADAAVGQLHRDEIDLLVIAPDDALSSLEKGEKADFTVIHTEVDPIIRRSIGLISTLSVDEINRQVLAEVVSQIQEGSTDVEPPVTGLSASAGALVVALEAGDADAAEAERANLTAALEAASAAQTSGVLYEGVAEALGITAGSLLGGVLLDLDGTDPSNEDALENARAIQSTLEEFETQLDQAQELEPQLLVSPFGVQVEALNDIPAEPAVFYAPGVVMLLIQHLAVTFAALSLVRERELGITEVFRVSPLSVTEAMTGKYVAFVLIVGSVTAALSALMWAFGVPIGVMPAMYIAVATLVMLASLGLGFVISGISHTDSQAIQYSMIVLLVSIFFSGFIIPLDRLLAPVQALSFLLPATFGITSLHDVVFRATQPPALVLGGLVVYVLVGAALAWWSARRDIAR